MVTTTRDEWLTVKEACEILKISRRTLYRWRDKGIVTLYRIGGRQLRLRAGELPLPLMPPAEDDRAFAETIERPLLFGSPEKARELDRENTRRREELERRLASADAEEQRAILAEYWREWKQRADAFRASQKPLRGPASDSVAIVRAARREADRRLLRNVRL